MVAKSGEKREREYFLDRILELSGEMDLYILPDNNMNLNDYSFNELLEFHIEELISIHDELEAILDIRESKLGENRDIIDLEHQDPLKIIEKYIQGAVGSDYNEADSSLKEVWREHIPQIIKERITNWRSLSITDIYNKSLLIQEKLSGKNKDLIMGFTCDLSEIIFSYDIDEEEDNRYIEFDDAIAEPIYMTIESIILPHQEVMDKLRETNGELKLLDVWSQTFREDLKKSVKDRDEWRCVVCEAEKDLHVHHKIPRRLGGPNHKDNLVTLCNSCHKVIETADINKAFKKCLRNYKVNSLSDTSHNFFNQDHKLLKSQVEDTLENLLFELEKKNEEQFVQDIIGVIKKVDIIFNN
ncbi:HNH endonuclease [Rossellomorea vietnamensis]|uniref:HNH endonuclease n=1 Tax=Rossellomorea vietnamensis TaxID=218284 RepID=A0A5D4NVU8_9BACI|nr:HNH endonuclease signature motif containing protein [Rossellomorea vietnamensis]TYS18475.1 HNH endonuclease [Rossellomorea vietnamensis]